MGAAQEVINNATTTYNKLFTWQPVNCIFKYNADKAIWEDVAAPENSVWIWYGDPSIKTVFSPNHGDVWVKTNSEGIK